MNFEIGQRVRINVGPYYGRIATVCNILGDLITVRLSDGERTYRASMLLDPFANNGD